MKTELQTCLHELRTHALLLRAGHNVLERAERG